jgi:hypothetical protein
MKMKVYFIFSHNNIMSSAYYPLGMNSMPSSGYNHRSTYFCKQYASWKGRGVNSYPIGTAPGHIRPLTNNDPGNIFPSGSFPSRTFAHTRQFIPRPMKHFRKGRVIPPTPITNVPNLDGINNNINGSINENALINYNMNRYVKSSKGTSLGGGFGGSGLLNDMQDKPGAYSVKLNTIYETDNMDKNCKTCEGIQIVASYSPNKTFLQENPEENTTNYNKYGFCCNDELKAKRRTMYASTNLKKNYYTTTKQYLQNRCKTFEQKAFNFLSYKTNEGEQINPYYISSEKYIKPGSPLSFTNTYLANCQSNVQLLNGTENALITQMLTIMINMQILTPSEAKTFNKNSIAAFWSWLNTLPEPQKTQACTVFSDFVRNPYGGMPLSGPTNPTECQLVVYKPNNYQFAQQGAVDSSTRNLKLNVGVISTNAASIQNYNNTGPLLINANEIYAGVNTNITNLMKNKAPTCNAGIPLNFSQSGPFQNKRKCVLRKVGYF